jgi:hypothetical protein
MPEQRTIHTHKQQVRKEEASGGGTKHFVVLR